MWLTDRISSAVLLAFAAFYVAAGWDLAWLARNAPGPGFTPRLLAIVLALLAIIIWVQAKPPVESEEEAGGYSLRPAIIIFLCTIVYVFVMPQLGFPLSNFVLVLVLRRTIEPESWKIDLAGAVGSTAVIHLVFSTMLNLEFPIFPAWLNL
jgi:putative tricarboxylic transport membrane protein